jgi:Tfp pilus assembly protein PilW
MKKAINNSSKQLGFSLLELIIAMTLTLVVLGVASTLLASSFNVRNRENQRSSAIADAQRALNLMSREIANSGFGLSTNGIVTGGDSDDSQIRVRSDFVLDGLTIDPGEDVKYAFINDANGRFIVRMDLAGGTTGVIANRIDGLLIQYYDRKVTFTVSSDGTTIENVVDSTGALTDQVTPGLAKYVVLLLRVALPPVGTPGSSGYQPLSSVQLVSTVALRNNNLASY